MKMELQLLKCNIRIVILSVFLSPAFTAFSQNKVSGKVINTKKEVLSYANITAYYSGGSKIAAYTVSDENGNYNLQLNDSSYIFKVRYLGYKTFSIRKEIRKNEIINFKLSESNTELKEVFVKSRAVDVIIRNDTIKYNLKAISNGNEENLKDLLRKLPGIEIDENGKIKANGKKIDKLLIDGKDFFGDQHQLASENISAEMIKGISLLNNFKDFTDIEDGSKFGKTAMNIEIKDEYKGKIKGKLDAGAGYKNRYEASSNLYTFNQKTNCFLIVNSNNTGRQTFSIIDYISFRGGVDKFLQNNENTANISGDDLPPFIFSDNNFKKKNEQLAALNFTYKPNDKFELNSHLIFDRTESMREKYVKQKYLIDNQNITRSLYNSENNTFWFNNSYINAKYKIANNSVIEYLLDFSPQKQNDMQNNEFYDKNFLTDKDFMNYSVNQLLTYKQKISKYNLSAKFYHSIINKNEVLNMNSNHVFMNFKFKDNDYSTLQNMNDDNKKYGSEISLSRKIKKQLFAKINYGIERDNHNFNSNIENKQINNKVNLNFLKHSIGFQLYNNKSAFVNYKIGANHKILKINNIYKSKLLPFANLKFNFKQSHYISIAYTGSIKSVKSKLLIEDYYIRTYNSVSVNQDLKIGNIANYDNFSLNYFIHDLFSGTMLNIAANYASGKNIFSKNTVSKNDYNINYQRIADNKQNLSLYFILDKKFSKYPFSVRLSSVYSQLKEDNFIENSVNILTSDVISGNIRVLSNFKQSVFNFEFAYSVKRNKTSISLINNTSELISNKIDANLITDYKSFRIVFNNSFENFQSDKSNKHFYRISPSLRYKIKNWTFYVNGDDLLQINTNYIIANAFYNNYFEESKISALSGKIIVGAKYVF